MRALKRELEDSVGAPQTTAWLYLQGDGDNPKRDCCWISAIALAQGKDSPDILGLVRSVQVQLLHDHALLGSAKS
jgi:hypothetical protein